MPVWLGLILIVFPSLLFGQNSEGDMYFHGSSQKGIDGSAENKGILGGSFRYFSDSYYIDIAPQLAVPFDGSDIEGNISSLGEIFFPWGGTSAHIYYQNTADSLNDQFKATGELYRTIEKQRYILEYGDIFDFTYYPDYRNFTHIDNALYLLYKKFYRTFALHTYFNFTYRYFNNMQDNSIGLTKASFELYFSRGIKRNIGLKYGMYINKNISSRDSLIYVSSELYDPFAYDVYKIYLGSTIYLNDLLIKPDISVQHKIYNTSSAESSYSETGMGISFYADYPVSNSLLIYSSSNMFVLFDSALSISTYDTSLGIRYLFKK